MVRAALWVFNLYNHSEGSQCHLDISNNFQTQSSAFSFCTGGSHKEGSWSYKQWRDLKPCHIRNS